MNHLKTCAVFFLLFLLVLLVGCAGRAHRVKEFGRTLDSKIGVMTYDEAITTWGPPSSVAEGDEIVAATWFSESTAGAVGMPLGSAFVARPIRHGWELNLVFDKSRRLKSWRYKEW